MQPGVVVLIGAGETSTHSRRILDWVLRDTPVPVRIAILETPAGFEPNSAQVAQRIGTFFEHRLQNHRPQVSIVPARKRGTPFSPDEARIADMIPGSDLLFMGPGSPTYAVRQLRDSLTWHTWVAANRLGAALVLASAGVISASAHALPVYEIYKVGEELHWQQGLDLFGPYGLNLAFVPHWDNCDGGEELDTSRCYMGQARFESLMELLPDGVTVVGIPEHTALILDLARQTCQVRGRGGVTLVRDGEARIFVPGRPFAVSELGPYRAQAPDVGLPEDIWVKVRELGEHAYTGRSSNPPEEIRRLVEVREASRSREDWATADRLREQIAQLGWSIRDTEQGPRIEPVQSTGP